MSALALLLAAAASAQVPLSVSTTTARLGEPVRISAALPAASIVELDLERSTTDSFSIASIEKAAPDRAIVTVIPLAVGRLPVALSWKTDDRPVADAPPVVLDVLEPPIEGPGELKDIRPPYAARAPWWPWLLAAAAAAGAFWLWRRRRPAAPPAREPGPIPADVAPEDWAESRFAELEASELWASGRHKEFYGRLTEVVRAYLERRAGLAATRQTSSELLRALRRRALSRDAFLPLQALLERADLVKFSRQPAQPGWGSLDVAGARQIVAELAPKNAAAPAAAGGGAAQ